MSFYVTFGVRYKRRPPESWDVAGEPHPWHPNHVDGNGFVRVEAGSEEDARIMVATHFGKAWAFLYDREPAERHVPLGELGVIDADGLKWHNDEEEMVVSECCEKALKADPRYDRFRCRPDHFVCPECGSRFVHVCDEAEGCSWWPVEVYSTALRMSR